jgi:hypothetical protein
MLIKDIKNGEKINRKLLIEFYTTNNIPQELFKSFVDEFNDIFHKNESIESLKNLYTLTFIGYSFHIFLLDGENVVGNLAIIPIEYNVNGIKYIFGQAVGVYIKEKYRINPLLLRNMYESLEKELIKYNINFVYALPNDNAYSYWKNVVKWKDIGKLYYYAFPVSYFKNHLMKKISYYFLHSVKLIDLFGIFYSKKAIHKEINIDNRTVYYKNRLKNYNKIIKCNYEYYYRIYKEEKLSIAYLINVNPKSAHSFYTGLSQIRDQEKENINFIFYIGDLAVKNNSLIKIPKRLEPRELHFIGKFVSDSKLPIDPFDLKKWDISLLNFDVR